MNAPFYWRVMMSRTARFLKDGGCYHIQSQSNRSQKIFKMRSDFERYVGFLKKYKLKFRVSIYAYCLTPTTSHLIVSPRNSHALPLFMQGINQSYALFFNGKYNGWGKVWGQRYKSVFIGSDYDLFESIKFVEFIPIKEGQSHSPIEYLWSSCASRILGLKGVIDPVPSREIHLDKVIF